MSAAELAVAASCVYFFTFGAAYVFRPRTADQLGLRWTGPAGRTEIRCYYGALSWALAAYFAYLVASDEAVLALTGVLFLASAVLTMRIIGTTVDGAWSDRYTRVAVPVEAAFVAGLAVVRSLS